MIRVKRKHAFSLLEVVIAIGICMMSFGLLFTNTSRHMHKQLKILKQIETQRLLELSYFEILDTWIQNGSFDECNLEFAPLQECSLSDGVITFERTIKLSKTYTKTSTQNEQWKKLSFQVSYPRLNTSSKYSLLLKRVDKKFE